MPVRWFLQRARRAALAGIALAAAACQGTPTATSPIFVTDFLTGTVVTQVPSFQPVKTSIASVVTLTLVSLTPNTGVGVAVGIGDPILSGDGGCTLNQAQVLHVGESFQATATTVGPAGTHCLAVFEFVGTDGVGAIPDPLAFVVKFNHH